MAKVLETCMMRSKGIVNSHEPIHLFKLFLLLYLMLFLSGTHAEAQDYNNPCYYCHMNVLIEMKKKASTHWENSTDCEACHGSSGEHVDVEDNTIKPDSIWTDKDVHNLCNNCHDDIFEHYAKSKHAKLFFADNETRVKKTPSCMTCHGAHGQKVSSEIETTCIVCHAPLPPICIVESPKEKSSENSFSCKRCHMIHSLARIPESPDIHEEKK
jgi:hypothetical protein